MQRSTGMIFSVWRALAMYRMLAVLAVLTPTLAMAEPWLCTDANGNKAFSYEPESARDKNCVNHPIPSGNVWRVRPREDRMAPRTAFPRVDARLQKQRDAARREILERELAEERRSLAEAMKQLEEQQHARANARNDALAQARLRPLKDKVRVHMTNITNLQKELGHEG